MIRRALAVVLALPLLAACAVVPGTADRPGDTAPTTVPTTAPTTAPPTAAAPSSNTAVSTASLVRGADPAVPWYDPTTGDVHDGTRVLHAGLSHVIALLVAGDAYLLATDAGGPVTLRRLERTGRQVVLATGTDRGFVVSPGGSTVAYSRSTEDVFTLVVASTADGSVLHRRSYPNGADAYAVSPVALEDNRLLLSRSNRTWWWDFGASMTLTITHDQAGPADVADDRIATAGQDTAQWTVGSIATGERAWSLPPRWEPRLFSPRGTWLLSGLPHAFDPRGYDTYDRPLRVSRATDGTDSHGFVSAFGFYDVGRPRWESDDTFLALAGLSRADGVSRASVEWVRCRVTGACEAASPAFVFDTDQTTTVPVWVLAQQ